MEFPSADGHAPQAQDQDPTSAFLEEIIHQPSRNNASSTSVTAADSDGEDSRTMTDDMMVMSDSSVTWIADNIMPAPPQAQAIIGTNAVRSSAMPTPFFSDDSSDRKTEQWLMNVDTSKEVVPSDEMSSQKGDDQWEPDIDAILKEPNVESAAQGGDCGHAAFVVEDGRGGAPERVGASEGAGDDTESSKANDGRQAAQSTSSAGSCQPSDSSTYQGFPRSTADKQKTDTNCIPSSEHPAWAISDAIKSLGPSVMMSGVHKDQSDKIAGSLKRDTEKVDEIEMHSSDAREEHTRENQEPSTTLNNHCVCHVSQNILPQVRQWYEEDKSSSLIGTCSSSSSFNTVGSINNMELRMAVVKRCGVRNEAVEACNEWTVCENHFTLLTASFPVQNKCQVCILRDHGDVVSDQNLRTITSSQQDLLIDFIPGMITGQNACERCREKILAFLSDKTTSTSPDTVAKKLLLDDAIGSVNAEPHDEASSKPTRVVLSLPSWISVHPDNPLLEESSFVPPLRCLLRSALLGSSLTPPAISLKDALEGYLTIEKGASGQADKVAKIIQCLSAEFFHNYHEIASIMPAMTDHLKKIKHAMDNDKEKGKLLAAKVKILLSLPLSMTLMSTRKHKSIVFIEYEESGSVLCLKCPNVSCPGCPRDDKDNIVIEPDEQDRGYDCHKRYLSRTCLFCKKVVLMEEDLEAAIKYKDQISDKLGIDVTDPQTNVAGTPKICCDCLQSLDKQNDGKSKVISPMEFDAHDHISCRECSFRTGRRCNIRVIKTATNVQLQLVFSSVPSLRLLAACTGSGEGLTVLTCLELAETLATKPIKEAEDTLNEFIKKGIVKETSLDAFTSRCKDFVTIWKRLKEGRGDKVTSFLQRNISSCLPWTGHGGESNVGLWVLENTKHPPKFYSCHCSTFNGNDHDFIDMEEENRELNPLRPDVCLTKADEIEMTDIPVIGSPAEDASFYYTSQTTSDITFDFLYSDYGAVYNYLLCQNDQTFWTVTERKYELILERAPGQIVNVKIRTNEHKGRTVCKFTGPGIEYFAKELLPKIIKMTSSRILDLDNPSESNGYVDGSGATIHNEMDVSNPPSTEMVFVEEVSSSHSSDDPVGQLRKQVSERNFQCRGCRQKFKYESSYIKHEAACKQAGLPPDVKSYPDLKDGRKACPGCGRTFATENIAYLKHVRICPKIQPGAFRCKTCPATFSTARTLARHSAICAKYRKKKGIIMPQLTKRLKIQSVVSLQKNAGTNQSKGRYRPSPSQPQPTSLKVCKKPTFQWKTEKHRVICKLGDFKCPLCKLRFRLNQPYGKHLQSQECVRRGSTRRAPDRANFSMLCITIHPGIKGDDSIIGFNRVPSLRLICRGIQSRKSLIKSSDLPPLTIKEGLEIYYSLKRSDKTLDRDERWRYLNDRLIFQNYASSSLFMNTCIATLKTVNYFEEKVKAAKVGKNSVLMKKWNDKLNTFLGMPYHDNFSTAVVGKFRAFEFPSADGKNLEVLCMNCCDTSCRGCFQTKVRVYTTVEQLVRQRTQVATRIQPHMRARPGSHEVKSKPTPAVISLTSKHKQSSKKHSPEPRGTHNQLTYYRAVNVWKSKEELKQEYIRVGKLLGYKRPASLTEVIRYETGEIEPKTRMSHYCSGCDDTFSRAQDLTAHEKACPALNAKPSVPSVESESQVGPSSSTESNEVDMLEVDVGPVEQTEALFSVVEDDVSISNNESESSTTVPWLLTAQESNIGSVDDDEVCILPD